MRRILSRIVAVASALFAVAGFGLLFMPAASAASGGRLEVRGAALAHMMRGGAGYGRESCRKQLAAIAAVGGNWVSVTDFAFMEAVDRPSVRYGMGRSAEGRGIPQTIADAHAAGLKVLVKPHVWSRDFGGNKKWHGDIKMTNEADWEEFFKEYGAYILGQAKIAQEGKAEALSVGCELEGTSLTQEKRWRKLIADVRKVYGGYVIYSAAFAEWDKVPWWDAVDCIGIDAYMPLTDVPDASEEQLHAAWRRIYDKEIGPFQRKWNKPICFTEMGYTASINAAAQPWAYGVERPSVAYQARLYKVALEEAARHDYIRGVFLWKWFPGEGSSDPLRGDPFGIQNRKEVLEAVKGGFGR
jgi:hypothetical protein